MFGFKKKEIRNVPEYNTGISMVQETGLSLSTEDRIRRLIRMELFRQTISNEAETFEEADDFDFDDDEDEWHSPYEVDFDPVEPSLPTPSVTTGTSPGAAENPPPTGVNVPGQ